jgi:hypothetical protein
VHPIATPSVPHSSFHSRLDRKRPFKDASKISCKGKGFGEVSKREKLVTQKKFKVVGMLKCISGIASTVWVTKLVDKRTIIVKNNADDTHTCSIPICRSTLRADAVPPICVKASMAVISGIRIHQSFSPTSITCPRPTCFVSPQHFQSPAPPAHPSKPEIPTTQQDIDVRPLLLINPFGF